MSAQPASSTHRRVLAVGAGLDALAREALPDAMVTAGGPADLPGPDADGGFDLVVLEAASAHPQLLAAAIEGMAALPAPPTLILAGEATSTALVRALLKLDRSDILEAPYSAADLAGVARRLLSAAPGQPASATTPTGAQNRCWAVMSAVGGAGATTLAIELANAVWRADHLRPRVCLTDLNLADGQTAAYLGVAANMVLDASSVSVERLDGALMEMMITRPNDHLDVLASARSPKGFERAPAELVLRLLDVACQGYNQVIVDVPRHRQPWTLPLLGGCDEVIIVSELTVPALLAARSLAEELEADMPDGPRPRIVLNRLASRMFGPAPSMSEAEKALGRNADAGVSSDWEAAAASVNLGGAISEHRPKSKIVRDVEALAKLLLTTQPQATVRAA